MKKKHKRGRFDKNGKPRERRRGTKNYPRPPSHKSYFLIFADTRTLNAGALQTLFLSRRAFPTIYVLWAYSFRSAPFSRVGCRSHFFEAQDEALLSEHLALVLVRWGSGVVKVVHLCSMVVRLGVGVETQLVVFPRVHPQEVGVVAEPDLQRTGQGVP